MLHLITGANGAGKTLNTLKWVRERSVEESRPVCHNGRFKPLEGGELSAWKQIDIKNWQAEPDGTIFLVDECHNDFPVRPPSATPPDYVRMLAEHRMRGFDFYLVTQHPQNIDSFVRRLIGSPGWHRHLKRTFGANLVSVLEWSAVNPNCEKDGSGKSAEVTTVPFPKEVYGWYESASLHTGKPKIPKKAWVFLACLVLIPVLIWFAYSSIMAKGKKAEETAKDKPAAVAAKEPSVRSGPMTRAEYLDARAARIPDFPHTAPAYDDVTKPVRAPFPAACIAMAKVCKCYTQQGTLLQVSGAVCLQIVHQGFFVDWDDGEKRRDESRHPGPERGGKPLMVQSPPPQLPPPAVDLSAAVPSSSPAHGPGWSEQLAARNARVQSQMR